MHDRSVSFIVLPLGAVLVIAGAFLPRKPGICRAGLILGGIETLIFAAVPYGLSVVLRFAAIAAALAIVIFLGFRACLSSRRS